MKVLKLGLLTTMLFTLFASVGCDKQEKDPEVLVIPSFEVLTSTITSHTEIVFY